MPDSPDTYEQIYAIVRQIPSGRVASYGDIAALAGLPGQARLAGYAMHALRASTGPEAVPWWRVINARGYISNPYETDLQRQLLEHEGIEFNERDSIDMRRFGWTGGDEEHSPLT